MAHKVSEKLELNAQKRDIVGQKVNGLRVQGLVPAVLYGKGSESVIIQIPVDELDSVYKEAGESTLVYLKIGSETFPTIIAEVVRHPATDKYMHADFQKVRLDEKVTAEVPLVYVGESLAVKDYNGILLKNINTVDVEALPQDLPHEIKIDISSMKAIDDFISIGDIKLDKAEIKEHENDDMVATIQPPRTQEDLEAELAEPTSDVSSVGGVEKTEEKTEEKATTDGGEEKKEETSSE